MEIQKRRRWTGFAAAAFRRYCRRTVAPAAVIFSGQYLWSLWLVARWWLAAAVPLSVAAVETQWRLGNQRLELRFQQIGGRISASTLVNHLTRRTIPLQFDDFELTFADRPSWHAEDFEVQGVDRERLATGQRFTVRLRERSGAAVVAIIHELGDAEGFVRRRLEVTPTAPMPLRRVTVWKLGLPGRCWSQEMGPPEYLRDNVWDVEGKLGFGQPVFLEDTFAGLEFPAGYQHHDGTALTLMHHPGREIAGVFRSKTAVLGVAPAGQVAVYFRDYIEAGRGRPRSPEVQVDYNTWTTLMPATAANCVDLAGTFRKNLWEPYGVGFDSFTPDDGWDEKNSLWSIRTNGFPHGFGPLLDALRPMGTQLGLWLSPSSGYEHATWGGQHGYARNASFNWFLCQSDPRYRRDMTRVVPDLIRSNHVGFFKMDGFCASCETNAHSHHLAGDYAREANVDAFIELAAAMRQANSRVYLDPTSGMWLSPWWLWSIDSAWVDTYDGTAPAIVPSPNGLDGATTSRDALLRRRIEQNPGFDPGAIETLGIYLDPTLSIEPQTFFDHWQDNAMMVAGRGNRLLTCYLNPAQFREPAKDWAFLAGLIKWTRHHAGTLARTRLIGGDPYRREVYGYAHFRGQRGIITARNPFIQPRSLTLTLDESIGWSAGEAGQEKYTATVVFPYREVLPGHLRYGEKLVLDVPPYQTVVVQFAPLKPLITQLAGVRARALASTQSGAGWEVFGAPGSTFTAAWSGPQRLTALTWDGQNRTDGLRPGHELRLTLPGKLEASGVRGGGLHPEITPSGGAGLKGTAEVTIPERAQGRLYILAEDPMPADLKLECTCEINGRSVPVRTIQSPIVGRIPARTLRELPLKPWVFFEVSVPDGTSRVAVSVRVPGMNATPYSVTAGWWLSVAQPLVTATLNLEFQKPPALASEDPLPVPSEMELQRQVLPLQALQRFTCDPVKIPMAPVSVNALSIPPTIREKK